MFFSNSFSRAPLKRTSHKRNFRLALRSSVPFSSASQRHLQFQRYGNRLDRLSVDIEQSPRCRIQTRLTSSDMASKSRTNKTLSLVDRISVLNHLGRKESQVAVAMQFGVHPSQISRILKNKEQLLQRWQSNANPDRKRARTGKAEDVELALLRWYQSHAQSPINGPQLMRKAEHLASSLGVVGFTATVGWLERWKARHGIRFRKQVGEDPPVDPLTEVLHSYAARDVFSACETGLYWRATPGQGGGERVTLLLACNMDGSEKLQPLVVGTGRNPRCFRHVKNLPVSYAANKMAWMTSFIWGAWLRGVDEGMRRQARHIALYCHDCSAHHSDAPLTNVKLVFFPAEGASPVHPMEQGVVTNFKRRYRSLLLRRLEAEPAPPLTLLDALHMQREAWGHVTPQTISSCYGRASFGRDEIGVEMCAEDVRVPAGITPQEFAAYVAVDDELPVVAHLPGPGADGESEDEDLATPSPTTFAEALSCLRKVRDYMEVGGCQDYARLYELTDQVHEIGRSSRSHTSE